MAANINITSPNEICFISKYKPKEMEIKFISPIITNLLSSEKKSIIGVPTVTSNNTLTEAIDKGNKNNIRIVVISPINPDKQADIEKVKKEWPEIQIDKYNGCLEEEKEYFVIDVLPCLINNKKCCSIAKCTNFYSIIVNDIYNTGGDLSNLEYQVLKHIHCR